MSETDFKFQASVKDTDGDMVNVRANSVEEFTANLLDFPTAEYAQFKANVRGGSNLGSIVQPTQQQAPAQPQQQKTWGQQAPAAPAANGGPAEGTPHPTDVCQSCGQQPRFKNIRAKSGKEFQLWSCPNQRNRDDGHYSQFAN